jgi:hypothetical protein
VKRRSSSKNNEKTAKRRHPSSFRGDYSFCHEARPRPATSWMRKNRSMSGNGLLDEGDVLGGALSLTDRRDSHEPQRGTFDGRGPLSCLQPIWRDPKRLCDGHELALGHCLRCLPNSSTSSTWFRPSSCCARLIEQPRKSPHEGGQGDPRRREDIEKGIAKLGLTY